MYEPFVHKRAKNPILSSGLKGIRFQVKLEKPLLFNPPVGLYQRGEDRCQAEVEGSSATTLRPPNDMDVRFSIFYLGAILGIRIFEKQFKIGVKGSPAVLFSTFLKILPWMVRNYFVVHKFTPIISQSGQVFSGANNPEVLKYFKRGVILQNQVYFRKKKFAIIKNSYLQGKQVICAGRKAFALLLKIHYLQQNLFSMNCFGIFMAI